MDANLPQGWLTFKAKHFYRPRKTMTMIEYHDRNNNDDDNNNNNNN